MKGFHLGDFPGFMWFFMRHVPPHKSNFIVFPKLIRDSTQNPPSNHGSLIISKTIVFRVLQRLRRIHTTRQQTINFHSKRRKYFTANVQNVLFQSERLPFSPPTAAGLYPAKQSCEDVITDMHLMFHRWVLLSVCLSVCLSAWMQPQSHLHKEFNWINPAHRSVEAKNSTHFSLQRSTAQTPNVVLWGY